MQVVNSNSPSVFFVGGVVSGLGVGACTVLVPMVPLKWPRKRHVGDWDPASSSSLRQASVCLIGMAIKSSRLRLADRNFRVDYAVEVRQNISELILISHNSNLVMGTIFNKAVADPYRLAARPLRHCLFRNTFHTRKLPVAGKT